MAQLLQCFRKNCNIQNCCECQGSNPSLGSLFAPVSLGPTLFANPYPTVDLLDRSAAMPRHAEAFSS